MVGDEPRQVGLVQPVDRQQQDVLRRRAPAVVSGRSACGAQETGGQADNAGQAQDSGAGGGHRLLLVSERQRCGCRHGDLTAGQPGKGRRGSLSGGAGRVKTSTRRQSWSPARARWYSSTYCSHTASMPQKERIEVQFSSTRRL